jgi:hypothetical protein
MLAATRDKAKLKDDMESFGKNSPKGTLGSLFHTTLSKKFQNLPKTVQL